MAVDLKYRIRRLTESSTQLGVADDAQVGWDQYDYRKPRHWPPIYPVRISIVRIGMKVTVFLPAISVRPLKAWRNGRNGDRTRRPNGAYNG